MQNIGWKEWCNNAKYKDSNLDENIIFTLSKDAKILIIDNVDILKELPKNENNKIVSNLWCTLDFEKLSEEYDAIEVLISEDKKLYNELYGWDCDSILVMNPNVIEVVRTQENEDEETL